MASLKLTRGNSLAATAGGEAGARAPFPVRSGAAGTVNPSFYAYMRRSVGAGSSARRALVAALAKSASPWGDALVVRPAAASAGPTVEAVIALAPPLMPGLSAPAPRAPVASVEGTARPTESPMPIKLRIAGRRGTAAPMPISVPAVPASDVSGWPPIPIPGMPSRTTAGAPLVPLAPLSATARRLPAMSARPRATLLRGRTSEWRVWLGRTLLAVAVACIAFFAFLLTTDANLSFVVPAPVEKAAASSAVKAGVGPDASWSSTPAAIPGETVAAFAPVSAPVAATPRPEPSLPFVRLVRGFRIRGVMQGDPVRAIIDGRVVQAGDLVEVTQGVRLKGLDLAERVLVFEDATGALASARY